MPAAIYKECGQLISFSCVILSIAWPDVFKVAHPVHINDGCIREAIVARGSFHAGIILLAAQHETGSAGLVAGHFTMLSLHMTIV